MLQKANIRDKRSPAQLHFFWIYGAILVVLTIAAFGQVKDYGFVFDDQAYIVENPHFQHAPTLDDVKWAFTTNYAGFWHPLVWLSYMIDVRLHGLSPRGFHVTNLLLHVINAVLLFSFLARSTGAVGRSAFVAGLFALHPLHIESVAWIAERKDVLSTLFWILTLIAYFRYVYSPGIKTYLLVILFFILGLMSKPMLVTLPFVLLLFDWWPFERIAFVRLHQPADFSDENKPRCTQDKMGIRAGNKNFALLCAKLVIEKLPLFLLSAIFCVVAYLMQESSSALDGGFPLGIRLKNALVSYVGYMWKMIWPRNLSAFYPHPGNNLSILQALAAGVLLVFISVLALCASKRRPFFGVGWLWYLGTLVPVIGFVQVGMFSMADRFTYIPLIGLFIVIAWGVPDLLGFGELDGRNKECQNKKSPILIIAACICIATFAISTWIQASYWRNDITLFKRAIAVTSGNALACNNLGLAYERLKRIDDAIIWYSRALEIEPRYPFAHLNLGRALEAVGRFDEAIEHYIAAIRFKPDFAQAHNNFALLLACKGKVAEAIDEYRKAIAINPNYAEAHYNLAILLADIGRLDEAVAHYQEALQINPYDADVLCNLGLLLIRKGDFSNAKRHLLSAISIQPRMAEAHYGLAVILAVHGKYSEALHEIELCRKYGGTPDPGFLRIIESKHRKYKNNEKASDTSD
ncbi:MAG: tetratricopeptide repeat protein [Armatimonadota bacterium]|nr:tetratricopeptide repeat protein [Armatimonadota bacterium]